MYEMFEDTKAVIKSRTSKKDRQYNGQKKKDRQYNGQKKKDRQYNGQKINDKGQIMIYNTLHRRLKIDQRELHENLEVNSDVPER